MELEKKRKRFIRAYEKVRSTYFNDNVAEEKSKEPHFMSQHDIFKMKLAV